MTVFKQYAKYYDALYREKDYIGEVAYLERLFNKYTMGSVSTILDLGCGSGGHAVPLAERGYLVTGVDLSAEMLAAARQKTNSGNPDYLQSDLINIDLGKKFDVVISMFAVLGYITENRDLLRAFQVIGKHLQRGGLFFFDAWFGPAVLFERPTDRYKIVTQGNERTIRFAHPQMDVLSHTVTVNYKVIHISGNQIKDELDESHKMRFFFPREVEHYLKSCGFELLSMHPFMHDEHLLTEHEWNMAVVARKEG
jgi:SAM-dependent methyltransferase